MSTSNRITARANRQGAPDHGERTGRLVDQIVDLVDHGQYQAAVPLCDRLRREGVEIHVYRRPVARITTTAS
jgi:hypothetical protein